MVQHLPLELMDGVVRNLSNDDSVTDSQMLTAISRWAEDRVVVRSLSLLPLSGIAGLDLVSEGPGPHAFFIHPPFLEPCSVPGPGLDVGDEKNLPLAVLSGWVPTV